MSHVINLLNFEEALKMKQKNRKIIQGSFPGGSDSKESACSAGDTGDSGLIPGLGRSPGEGDGNSLQYSCLEISMDRGAWQTTFSGGAKSRTRLSD